MTDYLDYDQAAAFLHLTKRTLYNKVNRRTIPHYKIDGRILFDPDELEAWVRTHKQEVKA